MLSRRLWTGPVLAWTVWLGTRAGWALVIAHDVSAAHPAHRWLTEPVDGDVRSHYYGLTSRMMHGAVPYKDFQYEYPPLTLPFLAAAWSLGHGHPRTFLAVWMALMLALDAGVTLLLTRWPDHTRALWLWVVGVALIGPELLTRNDLIAAVAFVAGCYALLARSAPRTAGLALGAGVWAKVWPAVPLLNVLTVDRRRARVALGAFVVSLTVLAPLAGLGAITAMGHSLIGYHGHRPLEIESGYAGAVMLFDHARGLVPHVGHSFGSYNLASPRLQAVSAWADRVTVAWQAVVVGLGWLARETWRRPLPLTWLWVLFIAVSLCLTPVFSAQYVVWLLAAVCVLLVTRRGASVTAAAALTLAIALITQLVYPWLFRGLERGDLTAVAVLNLRNALVVALAAVAATALVRAGRPVGAELHWSAGEPARTQGLGADA